MDERDYENSGQSQLIKKIKELVDYQEENKYCVYEKTVDATPEDIYNEFAKPIVKDFLKGNDCAIIALGQTSEKTNDLEGDTTNAEKYGIIPRIADELFEHIYSTEEDIDFHIKISYYEVYRDKIRDLMPGYRCKWYLQIIEDKNRIPFVAKATETYVTSKEEMISVIDEAKTNRTFINTNDYEQVSLGHSFLLIDLNQKHNTSEELVVHSKLYIVDIAGSEKLNKSGMESAMFEETKQIKKSLSAFLHVITSLASGAKTHVPYRDTKLTRVLQHCFCGNSKVGFIVCFPEEAVTRINSEQSHRARKNDVDSEELIMLKKRLKKEKEKTTQLRIQLSEAEEKLQKSEIEKGKPEERKILERLKEVNLLLAKPCKDCELSRQEMYRVKKENELIQSESESSKEEMMKVLNLVEDLTNNCKIMSDELVKKSEEHWQLMEEHRNLLSSISKEKLGSDQTQERSTFITKQIDSLSTFFTDLVESNNAADSETTTLPRSDYESLKQERDKLQDKLSNIRLENDSLKGEVKEVLLALEELAGNYDSKSQELDKKCREFEELSEVLSQRQSSLTFANDNLEQLEHRTKLQNKRITEYLENVLKEMNEIGTILGENTIQMKEEVTSRNVEQVVLVRIYVSRLKSAAKSLSNRCKHLERSEEEYKEKVGTLQKTLADGQLQIKKHEMKLKALNDIILEMQDKKISLEEEIDLLNEECTKLKLKNKLHEIKVKDKESGNEMQNTLKDFTEEYKKIHEKQLSQLRNEVAEKNSQMLALKEENRKLSLAHEQSQLDFDKLKQEELDKSHKLEELVSLNERKEQVRQDLKGLEESVAKELQTLHNSRKLFVQDLQTRIAKSAEDNDDDNCDNETQREKIEFLERNLELLTKVHKQIVRDNAELRCELPKLEKRLRVTVERAKSLEQALRDAKEAARRDRIKFQQALNGIKEVFKKKNLERRERISLLYGRPETSEAHA